MKSIKLIALIAILTINLLFVSIDSRRPHRKKRNMKKLYDEKDMKDAYYELSDCVNQWFDIDLDNEEHFSGLNGDHYRKNALKSHQKMCYQYVMREMCYRIKNPNANNCKDKFEGESTKVLYNLIDTSNSNIFEGEDEMLKELCNKKNNKDCQF